jgi:hypothetical protein
MGGIRSGGRMALILRLNAGQQQKKKSVDSRGNDRDNANQSDHDDLK